MSSTTAAETLPPIAYFVSDHGFGHAARSTAVMAAIHRRAPTLHCHIFTAAPDWFFADALKGPHTIHRVKTDVGLVQRSPLEEDLEATVAELDRHFPITAKFLAECCRQVAALQCGLVICDIAALGIAVADALNLPSILVENFTWDWIYTHYPGAPPELAVHARYQRSLIARARYRIQAEPVCHPQPTVMTVSPVSRSATVDRRQTRRQLGVAPDTPLVLVTMGGTPVNYGFLNRLRSEAGCHFLLPGIGDTFRKENNLILLPVRSDFRHPDLIAAADAVVGKVGYSTLAEIYHSGVPFGFVQRPNFPESPPLAAFIRRHMSAREIAPLAFENGAWTDRVAALLALPRSASKRPNGAGAVADFVLARLRRTPLVGMAP